MRAVFFDLDNTLIDTAGASRKGMLEVTSCLRLQQPAPCALRPWPLALPRLALARRGSHSRRLQKRGRPARRAQGVCERTVPAARGLPEGCVAELPRGQGCRRGERLPRAGRPASCRGGFEAPGTRGHPALPAWLRERASALCALDLSLSASLRCPGGEVDLSTFTFTRSAQKRHPPLPVPTDALFQPFSRLLRPEANLLVFVCIQL